MAMRNTHRARSYFEGAASPPVGAGVDAALPFFSCWPTMPPTAVPPWPGPLPAADGETGTSLDWGVTEEAGVEVAEVGAEAPEEEGTGGAADLDLSLQPASDAAASSTAAARQGTRCVR